MNHDFLQCIYFFNVVKLVNHISLIVEKYKTPEEQQHLREKQQYPNVYTKDKRIKDSDNADHGKTGSPLKARKRKEGKRSRILLQKTMQNGRSRQNRSPRECKRVGLRGKSKTLVNTRSRGAEKALRAERRRREDAIQGQRQRRVPRKRRR